MSGDPAASGRPVAAFDFDGTLTDRDTLLPFLALATSWTRVGAALARQVPTAARSAGRPGMRDEVKAAMLSRLFTGDDPARLARLGVQYAESLRGRLRRPMLEQVAWHSAQGHALVIVSASLRYYLDPLAESLGFDQVIAVDLEVGSDGRLTGRLDGPNVRGEEKATRLLSWLGRRPEELWAYGDSSGDAALLSMATHPMPVTRRAHRHAAG